MVGLFAAVDDWMLSVCCANALKHVSLTRRNNDDDQQYDNADDDAHAHLHVFPPHLLAHPVGAAAEAICLRCEVVGLVL